MRGVFVLVSLGLAAACQPPARHGERPASPPGERAAGTATTPAARTGKVTGTVLDEAFRTPVPGATIVLASDRHGTEVELSDDDGGFEITVAPGAWRVRTYYADVETPHALIEVVAHAATPIDLLVPHSAVLAPEGPAYASCPPSDASPSPGDRDALIRAVLERYLRGTRTYAGPAPAGEPLFVESPASSPIRTPALPAVGRRLVLRTPQELEAEATRRGRRFDFVRVRIDVLAGDCAEVSIGPDVAQPRGDTTWICSCNDDDIWEKRDGRWHHREHVMSSCG